MNLYKQLPSVLVIILGIITIGVSGCSKVHKELGMGRHSPDEFAVVKRAPLSLPPEYDLLPPDPDRLLQSGKVNQDMASKAEVIVFGKGHLDDPKAGNSSPEETLLRRVGTTRADPNIRKTLDLETGYVVLDKEKGIAEKILFWKDNEAVSVVNANKERDRLQRNIKEGLPVNSGNVPTIKKKQSTIDKLF